MPCILCGGDSVDGVYSVHGTHIVRCSTCGLVSTQEQPSDERLLEIYGEDYFTGRSEHGVDYVGDARVGAYDRARFDDSLNLLEQHGPERGRLLDIGCATGNFLVSARERGWDVAGCELSADAARFAADRHGLEVFSGSPSEAGFAAPFDAVTMNHVLEHIPAPDRFLREEVAPVLAQNGLLLIEVPNFGSVQSRVNGSAWADLRPEQHLFHFTAETLTRLLVASGYQVLEIASLPEAHVRILGPLVYFGVRDPESRGDARRTAMSSTQSTPARGEGLRDALRRLSRAGSMPFARHYARRLMELRLVAIARRADGP